MYSTCSKRCMWNGNSNTDTCSGGSYNGCSGTRTYTYTYTDCAGLSSDWVYTYTILPPVVNMPGPGGSTVECAANATMPVPPVIKDNCGRQLDVSTGVPGSDPGCMGLKPGHSPLQIVPEYNIHGSILIQSSIARHLQK